MCLHNIALKNGSEAIPFSKIWSKSALTFCHLHFQDLFFNETILSQGPLDLLLQREFPMRLPWNCTQFLSTPRTSCPCWLKSWPRKFIPDPENCSGQKQTHHAVLAFLILTNNLSLQWPGCHGNVSAGRQKAKMLFPRSRISFQLNVSAILVALGIAESVCWLVGQLVDHFVPDYISTTIGCTDYQQV